jgi:hypothetical protein
MSLARLQRSDVVALLASIALLLVMAADWYSTVHAEEARRVEEFTAPQGGLGGEVERTVDRQARERAEAGERNAWQADGGIDRVILVVLLAAYGLALLSAFLRAAGRRLEPPFTPAAFGALAAGLGALLVAYRIWQEPGFDNFNTVRPAAPLAIFALGILSLALATAYRGEESGRAWARMDRVDAQSAEQQAAPTT